MRRLTQLAIRTRMLFSRRRESARLDDELAFHLDRQIAENLAAGMTREEARLAALRSFGNPALTRDHTRSTWNWSAMESLLRDLRYGARTLRRTPGFATIAIAIMALGIGANVALFTVVRSVILKPLPFEDPNRLAALNERMKEHSSDDNGDNIVAPGIYSAWRKNNTTFSSMGLYQFQQASLSGENGQMPEKLESIALSWDLFPTLGVQPALGRSFTAADDTHGAPPTVMLSWSLWNRRFAADPRIVNSTVHIDGKPFTVVGVMPAGFAFPNSTTQIWVPVYQEKPVNIMLMPDNHMFQVVGRLKPGITMAQARADLSMLTLQVHNSNLEKPFVSSAANAKPLIEQMVGDVERPLYVLLAATCCVLLIACLNVANLLVARAAARRRELAIRTALGGGWMRLMRERVAESTLLSAAGGAVGLLLASAALQWLTTTRKDLSRVEAIHMDGVVAAFTVGIIVFCALLAGVISSFSSSGRHILRVLSDGSRSMSGSRTQATLRRALLAIQVGLTVVLLVGAGLLLHSYQRLRSSDMGCLTKGVLTMRLGLPGARYKTPGPAPVNFFDTLLERIRALPGVEAAGIIQAVPGQGWWEDSSFTIVEHPPLPQGQGTFAINRWADPGYFAAIGIPVVRGRVFNPALRLDDAREVVISQAFVNRYFPNEEPLGKHLHTQGHDFTIVGVVGDTRFVIGEVPQPMKYFSFESGDENYGTIVVRSSRNVESFATPVEKIISEMDHDLPVADVLTMDQLLGETTLDESFNATLLAAFAGLSLLLAAVGLFGVMSYIVAQRTTEIGIRIALGARRDHVLRRMMADGLRPALLGLLLGLAASAAATRMMEKLLYEVKPLDPAVFAAVAVTLILVAAIACLVPAWRASRLDPMQALRSE